MANQFITTLCLMASFLPSVAGAISVVDDAGNEIRLKHEARRIITLAPHIVEQLFAIGAGDRIVGTVSYSDYPEAATTIPEVGSYESFDLEAIIALKPDLVIGWLSGNSSAQLAQLKDFGIPLFFDKPRRVDDIATNIERLGVVTGNRRQAAEVAAKFREGFRRLAQRYQSKRRVTLFYQLWHQPLMTINGEQIIDDILTLCGGENIFRELTALTPVVSREAVIAADPEVIITSGMKDARPESHDEWKRWGLIRAVSGGHLYSIDPDLVHRASPRMLWGAEQICAFIDSAR